MVCLMPTVTIQIRPATKTCSPGQKEEQFQTTSQEEGKESASTAIYEISALDDALTLIAG